MLSRVVTARRIRTAVYGVFVAFAAAFIVLSGRNVIWGVFGLDAEPAPAGAPAGRVCGEKIAALAHALDRGVAAAAGAHTEPEAMARMRAALAPEWEAEADSSAACAADPHGAAAWAALLRLRRAEEVAVARHVAQTGPLRHELAAYLPR
jgi:hypothetical protein